MKNLKLVAAVAGITVAVFGSYKINAKGGTADTTGVKCESTGLCGKTDTGQNIDGTYR